MLGSWGKVPGLLWRLKVTPLRRECASSWARRVSTSVADEGLRDRVAPDMNSDVTSSDENIDTVVDVAMSNIDAEYEVLVAEYAVSLV